MKLSPFSRYKVCGSSMLPTLKPGQDILAFNWAYLFNLPKKGDLVVIKFKDKEIIKRIQKSGIRGIFVLGDNLGESTDSRRFGPVDKKNLLGKVVLY